MNNSQSEICMKTTRDIMDFQSIKNIIHILVKKIFCKYWIMSLKVFVDNREKIRFRYTISFNSRITSGRSFFIVSQNSIAFSAASIA